MTREQMIQKVVEQRIVTNEQAIHLSTGELRALYVLNGGKGSGNFGHSGIPGQVGGSGPGGGSGSSTHAEKLQADYRAGILGSDKKNAHLPSARSHYTEMKDIATSAEMGIDSAKDSKTKSLFRKIFHGAQYEMKRTAKKWGSLLD